MKQQTMPQFTIHDRLRKARESAGFTVRQLEERGVASRNTIYSRRSASTAVRDLPAA